MKGAIQSLISKGAISVVNPCPQQFISTLFSRERTRDRGVPPSDQSKGTKEISSEGEVQNGGFPYCSLSSTQGRLYGETRPTGRDAYYAVPIHPESRKYLRFQFKGTTYEFRCLPFGLSLAPRVFTRILRPIVAKLRSEGI